VIESETHITNYQLPVEDFGGDGPDLHFANANGYPPAAYTPLFESLTPHYHVRAMRARPLQPGAEPARLRSWAQLTDELIEFLDAAGARGWIGVGHSLGAVITTAAALRRPELFRAVVAIEPVFLTPRKQLAFDFFRLLGLAGAVHPLVAGARRRRLYFASADEMYARYRQAPVFSRIDDRGLRAYVAAAALPRPDGQGVELAFSPDWEAQVYATGPFNLWPRLGRLSLPLLAIRGAESDIFGPAAVSALRRALPAATFREVPGAGHLAPLEKPAEVGRLILEFVQ
jgi:pimeloyl-ACP methyl ester carboxylesterase